MIVTSQQSPDCETFSGFDVLYDLIKNEVAGLRDKNLDFTSDNWEWSHWSIRMQLSHMASLIPRWIIVRLGHILYPDNDHGYTEINPIASSNYDRRLDDEKYWEIQEIMPALEKAINLVIDVLNKTSIEILQSNKVKRDPSPQWELMSKAHYRGVTAVGNPAEGTMTIEATIRHIYFEQTTHLFNIQRLKKAQGLSLISEVPKVGYWVLPGWDISQP